MAAMMYAKRLCCLSRCAGIAISVLLVTACGRAAPEPDAPDEEPLARVGDTQILESDFAFEIERRQATGRPIGDTATVLQELIEREVMIQAAHASGVKDDPAVQRDLENQLMVKWLDQSLHARRDQVTVSDETLRAVYEDRISEFTRHAMNRLAILYRRLSSMDPDETVQELVDALNEARTLYFEDPAGVTQNGRIPGFGTIAAEHSEHQVSRYRGGDLGWIRADAENSSWPVELVQVGHALEVGAVSDVMHLEDGLYVIMKIDHRPPQITPFEEAAISLRRRIIREKQEAVTDEFMAQLMQAADVEINEEQAARLAIPRAVAPEEPRLRPRDEVITLPSAP